MSALLSLLSLARANWKLVALVGAVLAVFAYHRLAVRSAYNDGRKAEREIARIEAGKRIKEMEQSNEKFRSLSARDRCRAFMRDSGLPERHCN